MATGSLTVVGTGIKMAAHITAETESRITNADCLFYLTNGAIMDEWLQQLNPQAEDLARYYAKNKRRIDTYQEMTDAILNAVRAGKRVCAAFYGHPGIFVWPAHAALQQARREGFQAQMMPGISAEDCLFADLGIDPAQDGCQSYEATDFLVRPRQFDVGTGLILWQIGVVGNLAAPVQGIQPAGLVVLQEVLIGHYGATHEVYVYEAAQYPIHQPVIQQVALQDLLTARITAISTMYIPPLHKARIDEVMLGKLNLSVDALKLNR